MSLSDAFIESEVANKQAGMADTWGHLFPKEGCKGSFIIGISVYDGAVILVDDCGIAGSPWWSQASNDFAYYEFDLNHDYPIGTIFKVDVTVKIVRVKGGEAIRIHCNKRTRMKL